MKYDSCFLNDYFNWKQIYSLPRRVTSDTKATKLYEFQFNLLNKYFVTNDFLYEIGIVHSPTCSFCGNENESLEHILMYCNYAKAFWAEVIKWLGNLNIIMGNLSNREIILGKPNYDDELFVDHVLSIAKIYLYLCRCSNTFPLYRFFL